MTKSNWFIVATEGATVDGRHIERKWLSEIAESYDPKKYGARINIEHIKFGIFDPDYAHSKSYGDVIACKAEENEEGKLQLFAQIAPTDELVALVKDKQKVYTSIEVRTNFAQTGKAYLTGLAVTDSPASLGTQYLSFTANGENVGDIFTTDALEAVLTFTQDKPSFIEQIKAMFGNHKQDTKAIEAQAKARFTEHEQAQLLLASKVSELEDKLTEAETAKADVLEKLSRIEAKFDKLETQEAKHYTPMPKATGETAENASGRFF